MGNHDGRRQVNGKKMLAEAMAAGQAALVEAVSQRLNELLVAAVTALLGREYHVRREGVSLGWNRVVAVITARVIR